MEDFEVALARFVALDEGALGRPWPFRDKPMDVRYALYRTLEEAQEVLVGIAARAHPESRRILALAQRAFGDLRGLLAELPGELLDRAPRAGEWSLREVLGHIALIERRYALQTRYAVERAEGDPIRIPADRLPPLGAIDARGEIGELLARIGAARAETDERLGALGPAALTRPTQWMHYDIDVRFRLHRFAAHLVEHTVQCEKTLAALGWRPTEGRLIVRRLTALLGELEGLGAGAEAREIEARLVDRSASALI
jgi:hypothetical protein